MARLEGFHPMLLGRAKALALRGRRKKDIKKKINI